MYYIPSVVGAGGIGETMEKIKKKIFCDPTVVIGDWVTLKSGKAIKAQANSFDTMPVIGYVISKDEITLASVITEGWVVLSGLVGGKEYFISPTIAGSIQNTPPVNPGEIVQKVGTAQDTTNFYIDVDSTIIQL